MTTLLTRDAILSVNDRRFAEVDVPEWGGTVRIATLDALHLIEYHGLLKPDGTGADHVGWLLASSIVDADGNLIFTPADAAALQTKNPVAVLRVFNEAAKLNALASDSAEDARGE